MRTPLAALVVAAILPVLVGQSISPVESIIDRVAGGGLDPGGAPLPKDVPSDIPIVDGEIQFGAGFATGDHLAWDVRVNAADPAMVDAVGTQLTGAGSAANEIGDTIIRATTGSLATVTNDRYTIAVVVTTEGGRAGAARTV